MVRSGGTTSKKGSRRCFEYTHLFIGTDKMMTLTTYALLEPGGKLMSPCILCPPLGGTVLMAYKRKPITPLQNISGVTHRSHHINQSGPETIQNITT